MNGGPLYFNLSGQGVWYIKPPAVVYKFEKIKGKLFISTLTVNELKGETPPADTKIILYGDGKSLKPAFMALTGAGIGKLGKASGKQYGVITSKSNVKIDGINKTKLVIEGVNGISSYYVDPSVASTYGIDTLIGYTLNAEYEDDQIAIDGGADISSDNPDAWNLAKVISGAQKGIVDTAQDEGIIFEGNKVEFYRPGEVKVLLVDLRDSKRIYKKAGTSDIETGDIIFYKDNEGIKDLAIVVKY